MEKFIFENPENLGEYYDRPKERIQMVQGIQLLLPLTSDASIYRRIHFFPFDKINAIPEIPKHLLKKRN